MEPDHPLTSVVKGGIGISSATLGVVATHLHEVEQWLRVASALVGLVVAILTALSLANGLAKGKRRKGGERESR